VTVEEVRGAARAHKRKGDPAKGRHRVPLEAKVLEALLEKAGLGAVEVKVTGETVSLRQIPLAKVNAVGAVLARFEPGEEEAAV
jgi:hypothetical protein